MTDEQRVPFDREGYERRARSGTCFVCAIVRSDPEYPAHVIWRDEHHIAFLNRWPTLRGYSVLAPIEHREDVVRDVGLEEHLRLQTVLHRLGRAIAVVVPTERLYVLSLGSKQGNSHVHWHLAPLPPGTPYGEQQYAALNAEVAGILSPSDHEQTRVAADIAAAFLRTTS